MDLTRALIVCFLKCPSLLSAFMKEFIDGHDFKCDVYINLEEIGKQQFKSAITKRLIAIVPTLVSDNNLECIYHECEEFLNELKPDLGDTREWYSLEKLLKSKFPNVDNLNINMRKEIIGDIINRRKHGARIDAVISDENNDYVCLIESKIYTYVEQNQLLNHVEKFFGLSTLRSEITTILTWEQIYLFLRKTLTLYVHDELLGFLVGDLVSFMEKRYIFLLPINELDFNSSDHLRPKLARIGEGIRNMISLRNTGFSRDVTIDNDLTGLAINDNAYLFYFKRNEKKELYNVSLDTYGNDASKLRVCLWWMKQSGAGNLSEYYNYRSNNTFEFKKGEVRIDIYGLSRWLGGKGISIVINDFDLEEIRNRLIEQSKIQFTFNMGDLSLQKRKDANKWLQSTMNDILGIFNLDCIDLENDRYINGVFNAMNERAYNRYSIKISYGIIVDIPDAVTFSGKPDLLITEISDRIINLVNYTPQNPG